MFSLEEAFTSDEEQLRTEERADLFDSFHRISPLVDLLLRLLIGSFPVQTVLCPLG